jgi:hypothetical protein
MIRQLAGALAIAALFALAAPAGAHDPGLSEAEIDLGASATQASWWIDASDVSGPVAAAGALRLSLDGVALAPSSAVARRTWDGHQLVRLVWPGVPRERLRVTAELLAGLPLGHRLHVRVWDELGRLAAEAVLSARDASLEHEVAPMPGLLPERR